MGGTTSAPTPDIITAAITDDIANSALAKVNQIGVITETLEAMALCHKAGYKGDFGELVSQIEEVCDAASGHRAILEAVTTPTDPRRCPTHVA